MSAYRDGFVTSSDGLAIYYRDYSAEIGSRLPLLCLPGLTRNSKDFEEFAALMSTQRRVLCMDFRGRGRSAYAPSVEGYTPVHELGDIVALLSVLGLKKAIFIGTSRGGMVTQLAAATRPDIVAGAVLNDIGPEASPVGIQRIMGYAGVLPPVMNWDEAVQQVKQVNHTQYSNFGETDWQRVARKMYVIRDGRPVLDYDPQVGASIRLPPPPDLKPTFMWDIFKALDKIPTLAIRGGISDLLSEEILAKMVDAKRDLMTCTVPGQGHVPLLETPIAFNAIQDFLRRVDSAS